MQNPRKMMSKTSIATALCLTTCFVAPSLARADNLSVVTTIKPIHSLVAGVMEGAGEPALLVDGANSPHGFSLKPSQAEAIQSADLVVWVGEGLEGFMIRPIETLGENAHILELADYPGVELLDLREGGTFEAHDHDHGHGHGDDHADHDDDHDHDHGHEEAHSDHDDHDHDHDHDEAKAEADHDHDHDHGHEEAHSDHDHDHDHEHDEAKAEADHDHDHDHGHEEAHSDHDHDHDHEHDEAKAEHDHDHDEAHAGHDHGAYDAHIWLSPDNAAAITRAVAEELAELDPANADLYGENADRQIAELEALSTQIEEQLADVQGRAFIAFHDAYHYFEDSFGVEAAGAITLDPERRPGARRIAEIRAKLQDLDAACVFSEPQFEDGLVGVIAEGTDARTAVLDPLGAALQPGPGLYTQLLTNMADSFEECLSPKAG